MRSQRPALSWTACISIRISGLTGLVLEAPGVAQSIRLSQAENNGEIILPPAVYHDLLEQGLLAWVEDKVQEQ